MITHRRDKMAFPMLLIAGWMILVVVYTAQAVGDLERGKAIYEGHCASCHGMNGDGNGPDAAGLTPSPTNFKDTTVMGTLTDNDLQQGILQGKPGTAMKGYGTIISPQELDDLIAYIRSLKQ